MSHYAKGTYSEAFILSYISFIPRLGKRVLSGHLRAIIRRCSSDSHLTSTLFNFL